MTVPTFETEEAVEPAHPLGVEPGEVVVDGDEVHAAPGERVEVAGQRRDERLALAGLHLRDPAEVQRRAAHDLDVEVALAEHPLARPRARSRRPREAGRRARRRRARARARRRVHRTWPGRRGRWNSAVRATSCSSLSRSTSGSSAETSGTIAWTALSRLPSPAWRSFWKTPMRVASVPGRVRGPGRGRSSARALGRRRRASRAPRTSPLRCASAAAASRGCCARGS